jgi:hypothetical protein
VRRASLFLIAALTMTAAAAPAAAAAFRPPKPRLHWIGCWPRSCGIKAPQAAPGQRLLLAVSRARPPLYVEFRRSRGRRAVVRAGRRSRTRFVVRVPGGAVSARLRVASRRGPWSNRSRLVRIVRPPRGGGVGGSPSGTAFDGTGMWIWVLGRAEGGNLDAIVSRARQHGIRTVFLKSGDGTSYWSSQFTAPVLAKLKAAGLRVCGWQYVYGANPQGEAAVALQAVRTGADCFVIDAESEYEGRYAQAQAYVRALRAGAGAGYPIGLSSFPYVHFHPAFPYSVFLGPDGAQFNLPQMYWRAIGTSVDSVYSTTWPLNRVYGRPILPVGQLWQDPPDAEIARFRSLAAAYGAAGVSWWSWQHASDRGFAAVAAPVGAAGPVPAAGAWPTLRRGAKGDLVVRAQEHLRGAGHAIAVDGDYGPATETAVRSFQSSQGLAATGVLDGATWPALVRQPLAAANWAGAARASATGARTGPASARLPARRNEVPPLHRGG